MITINRSDSGQCLYCGNRWKLSITLNPDFPIDKVMEQTHKYFVKKQEIILHKLQCELNFYVDKLRTKLEVKQ